MRYDSIYSFSYSRRPGTPAMAMADDLPPEEKSRRLSAVQALQKQITAERLERLVGRVETVLVEGLARMQPDKLCGRTGGNHTVNFTVPAGLEPVSLVGQAVPVLVEQAKIHTLAGRLAS